MTNKMSKAWQLATKQLEKVLPEEDFETLITQVFYSHHSSTEVFLSVPDINIKKCLENHYMKILMAAALSKTSGFAVTVNLINEHNDELIAPPIIGKSVCTPLNPRFTFDLFVQGGNNQFAYDAAISITKNPADTYNPLYICAGTGLGKSHLLNALGHTISENLPALNVCYCSAEKFMYEMVNHLRLKKMDQFRSIIRAADVLLVDDIQFLCGKSATQEEFYYTFDALCGDHKQIVVTSDRLPREMSDLDERLRSRLECGLIVEIQPPGLETKIEILKKIAGVKNTVVPDEVIDFIASSDSSNIRELEGMIVRLSAFNTLQNVPINLKMAKKHLKGICGQ